eukprot:6221701-Alexandrium_andersonii.AAC.1
MLQLLAVGEELRLEALSSRGYLNLRAPNALELLRAGGEECLHSRPNLTNRAALSLKLGSGLGS